MPTVYLNWRGPKGRETIDEVRSEDFRTKELWRREIRRLCLEYVNAGMDVYPSRRPCAGWND